MRTFTLDAERLAGYGFFLWLIWVLDTQGTVLGLIASVQYSC